MAHVFITGGAGFIGSNLAHALVARGDHVRVLDDFSTGREENLRGIEGRVDLRRASITDGAALAIGAAMHAAEPEPRRDGSVIRIGRGADAIRFRTAGLTSLLRAGDDLVVVPPGHELTLRDFRPELFQDDASSPPSQDPPSAAAAP